MVSDGIWDKKISLINSGSYPIFLRRKCLIIESKFDKEYSTQWLQEVEYLSARGVRYSFVKKINGINTYKYTKTIELFRALAEFYEEVYYKSK